MLFALRPKLQRQMNDDKVLKKKTVILYLFYFIFC